MQNNLLEKLDSLFSAQASMNMEQIEGFIHEVLKLFDDLRKTLVEGTEEEKKEALNIVQEVQSKLQILAQKAYEKIGMSEEEVKKFLASGHFPKADLHHFQQAQKEIEEYQKGLEPGPKEHKTPKRPIWKEKI